jgi:predicted amidohydrolase
MEKVRVAAVQMDTQDDKKKNLRKAEALVEEAVAQGAQLVGLPEYFNFAGTDRREFGEAEIIPGPTTEFLSGMARRNHLWLHGGSFSEKVEGRTKMFNTTTFFNPAGEMVARYRKTHLLELRIKGGSTVIESSTKDPGDEVVVCDTDLGKIGLSICYDMRFPDLYRVMVSRGAVIVFVCANYSLYTGKDHWEVILRARAIDNQCYIVAPAQIGIKPSSPPFPTYGRSLIIDPWGNIIAKAPDKETCIVADLDMDYLDGVRQQICPMKHRRPDLYGSGSMELP